VKVEMAAKQTIQTTSEITLVTLQNCPANPAFLANVFVKISELGVNVDMISLSPNHGSSTAVSFTINDEDLGKILKFTSSLQKKSKIKTIVSSGNCKINVFDQNMVNTPGVAAKVFAAISTVNTDIRIVTTSDVDISVLITEADFGTTLEALQKALD
jgi:aspartate kinase